MVVTAFKGAKETGVKTGLKVKLEVQVQRGIEVRVNKSRHYYLEECT